MNPIDLQGFEAKFADDPDPWRTWSGRDEVVKRCAVLHAMGAGRRGGVLELGAGNGSNSAALARRALRLDATEATVEGTRLVASAVAAEPRARAIRLAVPDRPPRPRYDAIVVAELLYYLDPRDMAALARQVRLLLRSGGTLVLAHHRISFHDFAQHAEGIHRRFLAASGIGWRRRAIRRTGRWIVESCTQRAR